MSIKFFQQVSISRHFWLAVIGGLMIVVAAACQQDSLLSRSVNPLSKSDQVEMEVKPDLADSQTQGNTHEPEPSPQLTTPETPQDGENDDEKITIKIVFDNYPYQEGLESAWGFSAFITHKDHNVLFDTGAVGTMLLDNMAKLDIIPADVQNVVLSHEHNDHTAGLQALLSAGANPKLYLLPSFSGSFKKTYQYKLEVIEVVPGLSIAERISSTGEIIGSPPEQALVIDTTQGLIVITGCAHPGVDKMVLEAKRQFKEDIYLVLGGFHLGNASTYQVDQIIQELQRLNVKYVAPCHCTGDQAINQIRKAFGEDFIQVGVGKVIEIDL